MYRKRLKLCSLECFPDEATLHRRITALGESGPSGIGAWESSRAETGRVDAHPNDADKDIEGLKKTLSPEVRHLQLN